MAKSPEKSSLLNLSVEEENLAALPFAVLERRVGKRIGKLEIQGVKLFPDGTEVQVAWQVQGNTELGLPTEQDLDIFVALGVLTFRNNFAKTVSFTGREIARILNISGVHGKFYRRLKMAMDRFVPLRFRALAATDRQEDVKWLNVFQEASFSLDRTTGYCTGTVTWTDKLIQSMDSGFFRAIDAGRYMQLDGITAKHLYRFLVVAFERTDLVVMDARNLCTNNLGILNLPKYFSRLMQTLEPAFEQLMRIEVLGSYYVVNSDEWRIALQRHPAYVPERKRLLIEGAAESFEVCRASCQNQLERAGIPARAAEEYASGASRRLDFYLLERAATLLQQMHEEEVLPHVALSVVRRALDLGVASPEGRDILDWCEIAIQVCRHKKQAGQPLRNAAGLIIKIVRDPEMRRRLVSESAEAQYKKRFRQLEEAVARRQEEAEERSQILEYEQFRRRLGATLFQELPEAARQAFRKEKSELLRQQERFERIPPQLRQQEIDELIMQDLARKEAPPFENWRLRKRAQQIALPLAPAAEAAGS